MGNNNKSEGSVGGGVGGKPTLTAAFFWLLRKAERILEKIGIDFDLNRREVTIGGEKDQKRSGVDWRGAEWGSVRKCFQLSRLVENERRLTSDQS